jgi:hypothetical protein
MSALISKARCWSTPDGSRLVPEGDEAAAFLVANREGVRVSDLDLAGFTNRDEFFELAVDVPVPTPPRQIMPISHLPKKEDKKEEKSPRELLSGLSDEDLAKNCKEYHIKTKGLDREQIIDALLKAAGYES